MKQKMKKIVSFFFGEKFNNLYSSLVKQWNVEFGEKESRFYKTFSNVELLVGF